MTKKNSTVFPRFALKFYADGKLANSLTTRKLLRILFRIRGFGTKTQWTKAYLKFRYSPKYHNDGCYTTVKDLEHAYRCFEELLPEFVSVNPSI